MVKTISTPTGWNDKLNSIMEEYKNLSDEEKHQLFKLLKQDKLDREKSMWNIDAILEDLNENYVNIEGNKEMLNKKWIIMHINLPAIWKFNWFKFDCFISDCSGEVLLEDWNEEYKEKSYSMEEILKLYEAIIKYMKEYWIDADEYDARGYLLTITWLDDDLDDDYRFRLGGDDGLRLKDEDKYGLPIDRKPYSLFDTFHTTEPKSPKARLLLKPSK